MKYSTTVTNPVNTYLYHPCSLQSSYKTSQLVSSPGKTPQCRLQLAYIRQTQQAYHLKQSSRCTIHSYFPIIPYNHQANEPCNAILTYQSNYKTVRW
ncbi:hypothetical protein Hanom_Chr14g01279501 [Helianthus anomalus]